MYNVLIVDQPATQNFRFNQPANNMDNFPKNSLFGSQIGESNLYSGVELGP